MLNIKEYFSHIILYHVRNEYIIFIFFFFFFTRSIQGKHAFLFTDSLGLLKILKSFSGMGVVT